MRIAGIFQRARFFPNQNPLLPSFAIVRSRHTFMHSTFNRSKMKLENSCLRTVLWIIVPIKVHEQDLSTASAQIRYGRSLLVVRNLCRMVNKLVFNCFSL